MEEFWNLFDKSVAPLPFLQKAVLEEKFMNGLKPWIKADMECWEPMGLAQMMKLAQKIENREVIMGESSFKRAADGKFQVSASFKPQIPVISNDNKSGGIVRMRMITLRGVAGEPNRREGPLKRLSDAEFQARREKGLCFRCEE